MCRFKNIDEFQALFISKTIILLRPFGSCLLCDMNSVATHYLSDLIICWGSPKTHPMSAQMKVAQTQIFWYSTYSGRVWQIINLLVGESNNSKDVKMYWC
jgi:hypothetical protein